MGRAGGLSRCCRCQESGPGRRGEGWEDVCRWQHLGREWERQWLWAEQQRPWAPGLDYNAREATQAAPPLGAMSRGGNSGCEEPSDGPG